MLLLSTLADTHTYPPAPADAVPILYHPSQDHSLCVSSSSFLPCIRRARIAATTCVKRSAILLLSLFVWLVGWLGCSLHVRISVLFTALSFPPIAHARMLTRADLELLSSQLLNHYHYLLLLSSVCSFVVTPCSSLELVCSDARLMHREREREKCRLPSLCQSSPERVGG